jgi:hypothetical protein
MILVVLCREHTRTSHLRVGAHPVRGLHIVRRQGFKAVDRDAVAHEVEILHLAGQVVRNGGEAGQGKMGVEV